MSNLIRCVILSLHYAVELPNNRKQVDFDDKMWKSHPVRKKQEYLVYYNNYHTFYLPPGKKISLLRNNLDILKTLASEEIKPTAQKYLLEEVKTNENELAAMIAAFQKANFASLLAIEKANREELFNESEESLLRHKKKKDKV